MHIDRIPVYRVYQRAIDLELYYHQDEKNEVLNMAFDKLVEWPVGCVRTMEAKGAHAFFELCGELVKSEPRPRHEILNMVLTMIGGEAA